jgi:microcin C transport system substrate-binding protein
MTLPPEAGRVVLEESPERASGRMQGFVFNTRRDAFKDQRVRRALNWPSISRR